MSNLVWKMHINVILSVAVSDIYIILLSHYQDIDVNKQYTIYLDQCFLNCVPWRLLKGSVKLSAFFSKLSRLSITLKNLSKDQ